MRRILYNASDTETFQRIVKTAKDGIFGGTSATMDYLDKCRWFLERYDCIIIFTRDEGAHTCGWWKNPDYERCYHLSISFPGGWNRKKAEYILDRIFGYNKRMLWCEPPYSEDGKRAGVFHYRLFCDVNWNPIMPRGEVYSTKFTELGWKSFSELHGK